MKIVQINAFPNGSTGKIMLGIHNGLLENGIDSFVIWSNGRNSMNEKEIKIYDKFGNFIHKVYSHCLCKQGFASWHSTKLIIKKIDEINPEIVHLHNLHSNFINVEMLFNYLKSKNIKIFWTFHDCWAFTGKCVYFDYINCDKWKSQCVNCKNLKSSPSSYFDNSFWNYNKKKELFTNVDMTIITPSRWLATYVKQSFLQENKVVVINNGINVELFKHRESNFKEKYGLKDKKIILGVANFWSKRKGLNDFIELSKIIDEEYKIVLVGLNKKQISILPQNIIGITRTENQEELAEIYSSANLLFNPTYEDNYPTVNLEAIACGTPVLTYNTGGSTEFLDYLRIENKSLYIIDKKQINYDYNKVFKKIKNIIEFNNSFNLENRELLSEKHMVEEYLNLYKI